MVRIALLSVIMLLPTLLNAQASMEEIGDFRLIYGKDATKTIYSISLLSR